MAIPDSRLLPDALRRLRSQAEACRSASRLARPWDEVSVTGCIAGVAHVACHLGAIRQLIFAHSDVAE